MTPSEKDTIMNPVIIVGVDDSAPARAALALAATWARATSARLRVVHVPAPPIGSPPARYPGAVSQRATHVQKDAFGELFNELPPEPGWTMEFVDGEAGPALVAVSRDADLLVVGTRGLRGFARIIEDSVSEYVVRHADRPVLTVPGPSELHPDTVRVTTPHRRMTSSTEFSPGSAPR